MVGVSSSAALGSLLAFDEWDLLGERKAILWLN